MLNSIFKVLAIVLFLIITTCAVLKIDSNNRGNYIVVLLILSVIIGVI